MSRWIGSFQAALLAAAIGKPVEVDTIIIINFAFGVGPMIPGIR